MSNIEHICGKLNYLARRVRCIEELNEELKRGGVVAIRCYKEDSDVGDGCYLDCIDDLPTHIQRVVERQIASLKSEIEDLKKQL